MKNKRLSENYWPLQPNRWKKEKTWIEQYQTLRKIRPFTLIFDQRSQTTRQVKFRFCEKATHFRQIRIPTTVWSTLTNKQHKHRQNRKLNWPVSTKSISLNCHKFGTSIRESLLKSCHVMTQKSSFSQCILQYKNKILNTSIRNILKYHYQYSFSNNTCPVSVFYRNT